MHAHVTRDLHDLPFTKSDKGSGTTIPDANLNNKQSIKVQ